jgi:cysteine desulfurase
VARLVGAPPRSIVFTSGGTESNNLAIFGAMRAAEGARRKIITSSIEHSSVLAPIAELETRGIHVVRIAPASDGDISPASVMEHIDRETALIALTLANAEVGTIAELAPLVEPARRAGVLLHVDAAQAVGKLPVDVDQLGCDLLTFSAHKIGGSAGIGALYVRPGVAVAPELLGGPQEQGLRAGTPNLIGAIGFGEAARQSQSCLAAEAARIHGLAEMLLADLRGSIPRLRLNGSARRRIRNTLNLTFPQVLGESMLIALDLAGVEVSMGSACAAGAVEPSHVLLAMGLSAAEARSSLRVSLGWSTTADEIRRAAEIISAVWHRVATAERHDAIEASP